MHVILKVLGPRNKSILHEGENKHWTWKLKFSGRALLTLAAASTSTHTHTDAAEEDERQESCSSYDQNGHVQRIWKEEETHFPLQFQVRWSIPHEHQHVVLWKPTYSRQPSAAGPHNSLAPPHCWRIRSGTSPSQFWTHSWTSAQDRERKKMWGGGAGRSMSI